MAVSGLGVAMAASGAVLMLSGIRNVTVADTTRSILKGKLPAANPTGAPSVGVDASAAPAAGSPPAAAGGTVSGAAQKANQAAAMLQAAAYGWVGAQWTALDNVAMAESGWNNLAQNPTSGSFGIAQALGHGTDGTAGKYGNNYGANYGLTTAEAIEANNGAAGPQIAWMLGYIQAAYGTPEAAWAHEQADHYY